MHFVFAAAAAAVVLGTAVQNSVALFLRGNILLSPSPALEAIVQSDCDVRGVARTIVSGYKYFFKVQSVLEVMRNGETNFVDATGGSAAAAAAS